MRFQRASLREVRIGSLAHGCPSPARGQSASQFRSERRPKESISGRFVPGESPCGPLRDTLFSGIVKSLPRHPQHCTIRVIVQSESLYNPTSGAPCKEFLKT